MKQIRNGVFETNSSSCHSICIQKKEANIGDYIVFRFGEYGWEEDIVGDTASYLYTLIMNTYDQTKKQERLDQLKTILDTHNIEYVFEEPGKANGYFECGYVDHDSEAEDFVEAVLTNEDLLFRYLFGADSCIYTGNDNSCESDNMCYAAFAYDEHWNGEDWVEIPNLNHQPDRYEYFYKGN